MIKPITINGEEWMVVWSVHAMNRTYERRSHPQVAQVALEDVFQKILSIHPSFMEDYDGVSSIRSFPNLAYFVVDISNERKEIGVVTYSDITRTYPKQGDRVVTINPKGEVTGCIWNNQNETHNAVRLGKITV